MMTRSLLPRLALAALCATAACTSTGPTDPTDPGEENPPPPPPTTRAVYDMTVTSRYVVASSSQSCDGNGPFGGTDQGEYQFRIVAVSSGENRSYQTDSYGTAFGQMYRLEAQETGNFPNQSWTFSNLIEDDGVNFTFFVTEWDALAKDDYMNNRSTTVDLIPSDIRPNGGEERDRQVSVGVNTCGLTMFYDVDITRRDVPVT